MPGKPGHILSCAGKIGYKSACPLEIGARRSGFARSRLKYTQVVPAVGVFGLETQRQVLLVDGLLELTAISQNLREKRVQVCLVGRQPRSLAKLSERVGRPPRLRECHSQPLACIEIAGALGDGGLKQVNGALRLAQVDGHLPQMIERAEILRIELKCALEFGLGSSGIPFAGQGNAESQVRARILGALAEHGTELLFGLRKPGALQFKSRQVKPCIAGVGAERDGLRIRVSSSLGVSGIFESCTETVKSTHVAPGRATRSLRYSEAASE